MDITDFLGHNRKDEYLTATYRKDEKGYGDYFEYGIESEHSRAYQAVIKNVLTDNTTLVIRTSWELGYEINGFVVTQDGTLWQITNIITEISKRNKDVLRLMRSNPLSEYVISLVAVDNPMGVK